MAPCLCNERDQSGNGFLWNEDPSDQLRLQRFADYPIFLIGQPDHEPQTGSDQHDGEFKKRGLAQIQFPFLKAKSSYEVHVSTF